MVMLHKTFINASSCLILNKNTLFLILEGYSYNLQHWFSDQFLFLTESILKQIKFKKKIKVQLYKNQQKNVCQYQTSAVLLGSNGHKRRNLNKRD